MKKLLLSMATLLVAGSAWAQDFTRLTAEVLNAKTTSHRIAIRCTQVTNYNTVYNGQGRADLPLTADMVYQWVPAGDGTFYIKKAFADEYLQTTNITTFGTMDAGTVAKFTAVCPYDGGSGVNSFGGADCHFNTDEDKPYWVRLSIGDKWFNFNGNQYNSGTGVWTVQNILDLSDYYKVTINIVKDETETTETKILKVGEEITVPEYPLYDSNYEATTKTASDDQVITVTYTKVQTATVTYNYVFNEKIVATESTEVEIGSAYPDITIALPYGITGTKPEGFVSADGTHQIALTKEKEFTSVKTVVDAANIDTWYYVQMHANGNVTSYIEDNGGSTVEWTDKTVAQADIESHLWGFVGDVFGMKMVNKKTGKAIASTGSGNASMSDVNSATSFVVMASQANDPWFCFKYPTNNNYLNAQGECINHWADNDNGSSFKATEYKNHEVEVGTAGYATLYLGSKVFIPETVEAYVVSEATGNYASLTQVTGSLPANTGVILKGEGTHQFITSADAATTIESNLLTGSVENTYVAGPAYVLANGTNGVGLYKAILNKNAEGATGDTHFLNNANKAYLPATAGAESRFLVFNFGDDNATAIEGIEAENTADAVVYDLAGRRVQNAQKGLYIVNGKKVIK